jgi:hypothetical protein
MSADYPNPRVRALLDAAAARQFSVADFAALCLAAADQAGATVEQQQKIADLLPGCPHEDCDEFAGHRGRHTHRCDDPCCCEPSDQDLEDMAERADYARERERAELKSAGRV